MKRLVRFSALVLILAGAPTGAALAQTILPTPSPSVAYLNSGRYLVFQGQVANEQGVTETSLVKFDSQTGLTWLLRPAPATNDAAAGYVWVPVKN